VKRYQKAIVAVVGAVVAVLHAAGVEVAEDVSESIIAIATAALVYLIPNE
jgi:hypothetical protein